MAQYQHALHCIILTRRQPLQRRKCRRDRSGGQRLMQCQNCGLPLDPQQVAQTGRCPRCGNPVALASQGYAPQQPAFQSGPSAGAGGAVSDDESPTIRVRPQAPAASEPAPPPAAPASPVDPYAATQRSPQPSAPPQGSNPADFYTPVQLSQPPGAASGPSAQPPAFNPPPGGTDPYAPAAGVGAPPPPPPPQQAYGAAPGFSGPGQPSYGGPPQQSYGAPPQGGFGGPGQPPTYGSAPTFGGPGQPPPYGVPQGFSGPGQPPMPGFPGGPMAPPPKKSRTGLIVGILIAVLLIGGLGSLAALGFAGKGPLSSLGPKPTTAATAAATSTTAPTATSTSGAPAGFQQFTSSDNSFSLAYPGDWQQQDASSGTGGRFVGPNQQLFLVAHLSFTGDPAAFDNGFCGSSGFGGTASTPQTVTIGGQSWTQEECDNASGTEHAVVEAVSYKNNLYYIAYTSDKASFDQNRTSFFSPMEQSFQFLS